MNTSDNKSCLELLVELFPVANLSTEELKVFRSIISPYSRTDVEYAITRHRMDSKFHRPDFPAIRSRLPVASSSFAREQSRRDLERAQQREHERIVAEAVDSVSAELMPELMAQFNREHPSPAGRPRTIDPATNAHFREWVYDGVRAARWGLRGAMA